MLVDKRVRPVGPGVRLSVFFARQLQKVTRSRMDEHDLGQRRHLFEIAHAKQPMQRCKEAAFYTSGLSWAGVIAIGSAEAGPLSDNWV